MNFADFTPAEIAEALEIAGPIVLMRRKLKQEIAGMSSHAPVVSSAIIGARGEDHVREIIEKNYPGSTVVTAHEAKSGDITIQLAHNKIIVEVKHYSSAIPTAQVEKFERDLEATAAAGGIFVSSTPIAKMKSFEVRWYRCGGRNVPAVYTTSRDEHAILHAIATCDQLLRAQAHIDAALSDSIAVKSAYDLTESARSLSSLREDLSKITGEIVTKMAKTSVSLAGIESAVLGIAEEIRAEAAVEIPLAHSAAVEAARAHAYWGRYSAEAKIIIEKILTRGGPHKITKTKIESGGIAVHLTATPAIGIALSLVEDVSAMAHAGFNITGGSVMIPVTAVNEIHFAAWV